MKTLFLSIVALIVSMIAAFGAAVVNLLRPVGARIERYMQNHGLMLMVITQSTANAQTVTRGPFVYRHLDDAVTPAAISVNPGFRPRYVCVENLTDRIKYEWYHGMTSTHYVLTVAAGTRTQPTDGVLTVTSAEGSQPAIALAAAAVLQNKQYTILAY